jgi:hypothetical protein
MHPDRAFKAFPVVTVSRASDTFQHWRAPVKDSRGCNRYKGVCKSLQKGGAKTAVSDAPHHVAASKDTDQVIATDHQQPP